MTQPPPELWLARHGETDWTLSRQHTGLTDLPLTAHGEEQARELAGRLAGTDFAVVWSSPLRRALDTAHLAGFAQPRIDDRLVELDYGEYEGVTTADIRRDRPDWDLWTDGCPGGESVDDVGARMDSLIADLRRGAGPIVAFAHGHALRILAARWLGLPAREGRALLLAPAGIGVLGSEHGHPAVARWNP
jgi:probable phosphoglycerate mutase